MTSMEKYLSSRPGSRRRARDSIVLFRVASGRRWRTRRGVFCSIANGFIRLLNSSSSAWLIGREAQQRAEYFFFFSVSSFLIALTSERLTHCRSLTVTKSELNSAVWAAILFKSMLLTSTLASGSINSTTNGLPRPNICTSTSSLPDELNLVAEMKWGD